MIQDVRYALRLLRLNPGFAATAILSLALGAGANTAIFQLLDAIRLKTLPVAAPQELVELRVDDMTHARGSWLRAPSLSNPLFEQIRRRDDAFSGMFAWADEPLEVAASGESRKLAGLWVSGDTFRVLGVRPLVGRLIADADDRRGCGQQAVVLSYGFWQHEFGGDPSIVGRPASIGRYRVEVLGVTPPEFFGLEVGRTFDIAMPLCAEPVWHGANTRLDAGTFWWLTVIGRLKSGVSIEQARAIARPQSPAIFEATLPPGYPAISIKPYLAMTLNAVPAMHGISNLREQYSQPLILLLAITGLVLLIACANLAHLMLARSSARRRELAIRIAIGASPLRLARQLLIEGLLLSTIGVTAGLVVARGLSRFLVSMLQTNGAGTFLDLALDGRTFAFAAALALLTCLVFASAPVVRAARTRAFAPLLAGSRSSGGRDRTALRRLLLTSQIAVALALLVGTLLFVRSLHALESVPAGFQTGGVVVASVSFANLKLPPDRAVAFHREILEGVRSAPGVEEASQAVIIPLAGGNWNNRVWMDGTDPGQARVAYRSMVGTGYFKTMRTPLLAGREFSDQEIGTLTPRVVIVNQTFARAAGLGPEIIGRRLWLETTPSEPSADYEIVGLAADAKYRDLRENFLPELFMPMSPAALRAAGDQLIIRSGARSDALIASVRSTLDGISPQMRYSFRIFDTVVKESLLRERLMASLAGPFGALAVILTALGLYGVTSYTVAQRTHEIGIRVALGADRRGVLRLVLGEAAAVLAVGLCAGTVLAVVAGRAAGTLLFGLGAGDPASLAIAAALLALVAAGASYLPARRAASVDPVIALRQD